MAHSLQITRAYPSGSQTGMIAARDGWPLRTFSWPQMDREPRGSILFQTGRGDLFEKYLESLDHWHQAGWDITAFDWRGQCGSGRLAPGSNIGHADDFAPWIDDLADFYAHWRAASPGPHIVMGHSMGGHLVLRALVEQRIRPDAAILIAPMLGFNTPGFMEGLAHKMAQWMRPSWPAWPGNEKPSLPFASRQKLLTMDDARYADEIWWHKQHPELRIGPPSWQWLSAAFRSFKVIEQEGGLEAIALPTLFLATRGDKLVSPKAIERLAARMPNSELLMFARSVGHEILREKDAPRDYAMAKIDALLDRVADA